jgi:1,4-alpha-glucan branching enzyme
VAEPDWRDWARDPFAYLGRHGGAVRTFQPGATKVEVIGTGDRRKLATLRETAPGLFVGELKRPGPYRLRIHGAEQAKEVHDPYAFGPLLSEETLAAFTAGALHRLADHLGARPLVLDDVQGVRFSVWAPNARRVSTVGDFNAWDGRRHPMRLRHAAGVWEIFLPHVAPGARYKFEIEGADGVVRVKADPMARATETPPATASIVAADVSHEWRDQAWMAARPERTHRGAPLSVYEVHAGSWRRPWDARPSHDWDELADQLIPYASDLGFTHVELLPIIRASVRRLLGLPADFRHVRADQPGLAIAAGFRSASIDRCHAEPAWPCCSTGFPDIFPNDAARP